MFDIGFQKLIMVFIVSLFVVDPRKLPEFGRKLAKWNNVIRGGIHEVTTHVSGEFKELTSRSEDDVNTLIRKINAGADSQRADPLKETVNEKKGGA